MFRKLLFKLSNNVVLKLVFISATLFCLGLLAPDTRAQSKVRFKCKDARSNLEKSICNTVTPAAYREDTVLWDSFELTVRQIDLNGNGPREVVVWESSWAGTSGGSFWVLAKKGKKYRKVLETDTSWTPIILLKSTTNRWNDIVYYVTGGGVEPVYVTMAFKRSKYLWKSTSKNIPKGKTLIGKNWSSSVFGPIER